jgi:hypothetical protein
VSTLFFDYSSHVSTLVLFPWFCTYCYSICSYSNSPFLITSPFILLCLQVFSSAFDIVHVS